MKRETSAYRSDTSSQAKPSSASTRNVRRGGASKRARVRKIEPPPRRCGSVERKILLLLQAGFALSLTHNPLQSYRIIGMAVREWRALGPNVPRAIRTLYQAKLLRSRRNDDGTVTLVLSEKGSRKALTYSLDTMALERARVWDGLWRMVLYDIPEAQKQARDTLRHTLTRIGMYELQRSVFVFPDPCKSEIEFVIELYDLRRFVRYVEATHIDNEVHIRKVFGIKGVAQSRGT